MNNLTIYLCYDESYTDWEYKDSLPKRITNETKYSCKVLYLNAKTVDQQIQAIPKNAIVFNYCDGSIDGEFLIAQKIFNRFRRAIGAGPEFLKATERKSIIYKLLNALKIPVLPTLAINHISELKQDKIIKKIEAMGLPLFVKVEAGYDSLGLTERNICESVPDALKRCKEMIADYGPCVIQRYLNGREFTVPITGHYKDPDSVMAWVPTEKIFRERSFSYQWMQSDKWCLLDKDDKDDTENKDKPSETASSPPQPKQLIKQLHDLAKLAWTGVKGDSYGRVDIRQDANTKELFILEVNSVCSITPGSQFDAGLTEGGGSFATMIDEMIDRT